MLINELLGIKYPIFQGAMANIATPEFAAAVSNCGALGIIATGAMDEHQTREAIRTCKQLTDKPFGVNVMLMNPHTQAIMQVICEEQVAVVTTGAGNPGPYIPALKESGCKVIPVVASVALARRLEKSGVDAVIAEGGESGGHGRNNDHVTGTAGCGCCVHSGSGSRRNRKRPAAECSTVSGRCRCAGRYLSAAGRGMSDP